MFKVSITIVVLLCISVFANAQFVWPNGKKAAVVFTYDDALDCHLDVAVPQLDQFGLKGTFYCTGNSPSLNMRTEDWRNIAENGHELGNHTLFHPCDGEKFDWVKPEYDLNNYTVEQILAELKTANTLLKAIDGKTERTYGYTCSNYLAGGGDFSGEIEKMFEAGRCDGEVPFKMGGYNVFKTPSTAIIDETVEELIAHVEEAYDKGTIVVFMFHSVGGGYLNVGADEHRALLQYVKDHEAELYTGTFLEVMKYIKQNR